MNKNAKRSKEAEKELKDVDSQEKRPVVERNPKFETKETEKLGV